MFLANNCDILKMKKVTARLIYMSFVQLAEGQVMFFSLNYLASIIVHFVWCWQLYLSSLFYIQGEFLTAVTYSVYQLHNRDVLWVISAMYYIFLAGLFWQQIHAKFSCLKIVGLLIQAKQGHSFWLSRLKRWFLFSNDQKFYKLSQNKLD